jgi:Zn2+/Cd2+-exporting ATPase
MTANLAWMPPESTSVTLPLGAADTCAECVSRLRDALADHEGIRAADMGSGELRIELDPALCSAGCAHAVLDRARDALAGRYGHTTLLVDGMDCTDCARTISAAVARIPSVSGSDVSFATGRLLVEHGPDGFDAPAVRHRVEQLGYRLRASHEGTAAQSPVFRPGEQPLTMLATLLLVAGVALDLTGAFPGAWLYGAAVVVGIGPIARSGLVSLWTTRRPEIKFLMTVACVGAVAIGAWMEAALVVVLFSIGELLERRAVARARRELAGLVTLAPERARVVGPGGAEIEVAASELRLGQVVIVRPGERLPADGIVAEGRSSVDQAAITGESVPVDKGPGDEVFAGTLNAQGRLAITVEALPGDTTLARIGRLVAEAQARRSPSERWVDAFARVYTPIVIGLAVLVAVVPPVLWDAEFDECFRSALALLILACPCALVLSTPVTIVSALARASAAGVLVKGGEHLERAAAVDSVAFDKTGTLTAGRPEVVVVESFQGHPDELLGLAAALEQGSEHPLATAIVDAATSRGMRLEPIADFEARVGLGAVGTVAGRHVAIGKPAMFPAGLAAGRVGAVLGRQEQLGRTAVLVVGDDRPLGMIALSDPVRAHAAQAVAALARLGVARTVLITGDNEATARAIAGEVGIRDVHADLLPADKAHVLVSLGANAAMVGDGVNDAPALASASLGVAMGSAGSPTAIEVADVALMGDDLDRVPGLIGLARWAKATVRVNIAFSLATKLAAAVLLAFGALPLWAAVASDVGASLIVVVYSLRVLAGSPGGRLRDIPLLPPPSRLRAGVPDHENTPEHVP